MQRWTPHWSLYCKNNANNITQYHTQKKTQLWSLYYMSRCKTIRTYWFLSFWKEYCRDQGGPRSAIFGTIALDPLHFEVHTCLKIPECHIFTPSLAFHLKHTPKVGFHCGNFNIGNVAHIFLGAFIHVGTMSFHFRNISPWKIFHRHRQRHRHSTHFLKFG